MEWRERVIVFFKLVFKQRGMMMRYERRSYWGGVEDAREDVLDGMFCSVFSILIFFFAV